MLNPTDVTAAQSWEQDLEDFQQKFYPTMKNYGIALGEAYLIWNLNAAISKLNTIIKILSDDKDDHIPGVD